MAIGTHITKPYSEALLLSLVFQVLAWLACFYSGSSFGRSDISGGFLLNWRSWIISCCIYWFGFLAVFFTRRERFSFWRLCYVRYGFPILFIVAAYVIPRIYGVD